MLLGVLAIDAEGHVSKLNFTAFCHHFLLGVEDGRLVPLGAIPGIHF